MARSADNLNAVLQDTANAIKTKKGSQATICPRDFADQVASIPTGITPTGKLVIYAKGSPFGGSGGVEVDVTNYAKVGAVPTAIVRQAWSFKNEYLAALYGTPHVSEVNENSFSITSSSGGGQSYEESSVTIAPRDYPIVLAEIDCHNSNDPADWTINEETTGHHVTADQGIFIGGGDNQATRAIIPLPIFTEYGASILLQSSYNVYDFIVEIYLSNEAENPTTDDSTVIAWFRDWLTNGHSEDYPYFYMMSMTGGFLKRHLSDLEPLAFDWSDIHVERYSPGSGSGSGN